MKLKYIFTVLFVLSLICHSKSNSSYSENDKNVSLLPKILKQLNIKQEEIDEDLYVQKILPYDKNSTVVVLPRMENSGDEEVTYYDAYIFIVDSLSGKIKNKYIEQSAWTSDALSLDSIYIDTAPYILNLNTMGFGVRVHYRGASTSAPFSRTNFSLFIQNGNTLKPVIKNFSIDEDRGSWDTRCKGEYSNTISKLSIDKDTTNGFNNIIVNTEIIETKSFMYKNECESIISSVNSVKKILKYNKKQYFDAPNF